MNHHDVTPDDINNFIERRNLGFPKDYNLCKLDTRTAIWRLTNLQSCTARILHRTRTDLMIHGELRTECEDGSDCLRLEKDAFYGSDFLKMLVIVCDMAKEAGNHVAWCNAHYKENHRPEMDDTQLGINGILDDGKSWTDFPCTVPDTQQTVICYATRQLCGDIGYSVPDYLRINCFWIDVNVTYQHIEDQDGTFNGWLSECTGEQFAERYIKEAEHRPEGMSLMDFLVQRMLDLTGVDSLHMKVDSLNPDEFLKKVFKKFFK